MSDTKYWSTEIIDLATRAVVDNADRAAKRWKHREELAKDSSLWFKILLEELGELAEGFLGGDDPPELELIQLGGIIINWLRSCDDTDVINAWNKEEQRHP